jgi:hypothetical protein
MAVSQRHASDQQRQSDDGATQTEIDRQETAVAHDPELSTWLVARLALTP